MLYFIVNPISGSGKGAAVADIVASILSKREIAFEIYETEYKGHAVLLAAELSLRDDCEALVAAGGDGTFSEVLNGMDLSVPLGLIPCGTGNDFAAGMNISFDVEKALSAIIEGVPAPVDFMTVNGNRCLNVAGMGFDLDVISKQQELRQRMSSRYNYLAAVVLTLLSGKFRMLHMKIDDRVKFDTEFFMFVAANGKVFGGGLPIALSARQDDGLINAVLIKKMPKILLPWLLLRFMMGKLETMKRYVDIYKCKKIQCSVEDFCDMELDGEVSPMMPALIEIQSGKLRIFKNA